MIKVYDPYNLVPYLPESEFIKTDATNSDVDILTVLSLFPDPTITVNFDLKPTIFVDPEPTFNHWPQCYESSLLLRPNSVITVNGYPITGIPDNISMIFYSINSVLTVQNNPVTHKIDYSLPKKFLATALLGNWSVHRGIMICRLKELGLLDHCLVSYMNSPKIDKETTQLREEKYPGHFFNYRSSALDELDLDIFKKVAVHDDMMNTCTSIPGTKSGTPSWISQIIPEKIYHNSYMSIVAETYSPNNVFFMSEKISKPLLIGHPFVIFGGYKFLENLKKLGFKTFDQWIDERYDLLQNEDDRARAVISCAAKFLGKPESEKIKILQEMAPVLEHNRQLMQDTKWLTQNIINWINAKI